jgi:hypothetical protein
MGPICSLQFDRMVIDSSATDAVMLLADKTSG